MANAKEAVVEFLYKDGKFHPVGKGEAWMPDDMIFEVDEVVDDENEPFVEYKGHFSGGSVAGANVPIFGEWKKLEPVKPITPISKPLVELSGFDPAFHDMKLTVSIGLSSEFLNNYRGCTVDLAAYISMQVKKEVLDKFNEFYGKKYGHVAQLAEADDSSPS